MSHQISCATAAYIRRQPLPDGFWDRAGGHRVRVRARRSQSNKISLCSDDEVNTTRKAWRTPERRREGGWEVRTQVLVDWLTDLISAFVMITIPFTSSVYTVIVQGPGSIRGGRLPVCPVRRGACLPKLGHRKRRLENTRRCDAGSNYASRITCWAFRGRPRSAVLFFLPVKPPAIGLQGG